MELDGYHICNHTYDHTRWYDDYEGQEMFTLAEIEEDLIKSIRVLDELGFIDASRFLVYPGSSYTREGVPRIARKWTDLACTVASGNNDPRNNVREYLYRVPINAASHNDVSYYADQLSELEQAGNNWIIYYGHSKTYSDTTPEWTQSLFEGVMQNAIDNGYTVMTLNEAWKYRKAMYDVLSAYGV